MLTITKLLTFTNNKYGKERTKNGEIPFTSFCFKKSIKDNKMSKTIMFIYTMINNMGLIVVKSRQL